MHERPVEVPITLQASMKDLWDFTGPMRVADLAGSCAVALFAVRVLFQNHTSSERQNCSPECADKSKSDFCATGAAEREKHVFFEGRLMHEAVLVVLHGVNAAERNLVPRHVYVALQAVPSNRRGGGKGYSRAMCKRGLDG